jgi:hypothetical protein
MRGVVNGFLEKNILLSLIDLFIVNYDKFNDIAQLNPQRINKDLNELLNKACVEISESHKAALHLFAHDSQSGEFSIVLPEIKKDDTEDICASLSSRVGKYFKENNVNNVFTKIDILSWPFQSEKSTSDKNQLLNLYMKKILVGLEVRRFERIPYKMKLEMDVSRIKKEATHTIDISQGGLCFEGKNYLEKDARIDIGLNIPRRKIPIRTKARVAWIRNVEGVAKDSDSRYRAGLEFLSLNSQEKKIISGFLDSVSAAKKS